MATYTMSPKPLNPIDTIQIIAVLITAKQYPDSLPGTSGSASETQFSSINNM